ncbi:MAG: UDP-N-acetylglucosamine 2-epimerase (non-hydrolyzing) [Chloroflexota bacterium]|nr:UDP-N-acetylglucosamine 2-epimerase (non-hydrolyzing) [Chloroflexota bacterium]
MKIVSIVGARPQFIKAAMVSKQLREIHEEILVHTGQHYDKDLSDIFFQELSLPNPEYNLGVGSMSHASQTARMMMGIEEVLVGEKPDWILVYGDTNSTIGGALTAAKLNIPVAHVEAGPRMYDRSIPEEVNRIITDHISTLLFAPTQISVDNLRKEGIEDGVFLTGDVMLDSFRKFSRVAEQKSTILDELGLQSKGYLLATVHRARNTDIEENLRSIVEAFLSCDETIVFSVHPRTDKCLKKYGLFETLFRAPNLVLISPLGYLDSLMLTRNAHKILTDSGGLQKEAYFSKVPCITLDESTGWPETLEDGWNILVGSNQDKIVAAVNDFSPQGKQRNVFGDGETGKIIVEVLSNDMPISNTLNLI